MGLGKPITLLKMNETSGISVADTMGLNTGTATSGNARRFNGGTDKIYMNSRIIPIGAKTIAFKFRRNGIPSSNVNNIILSNFSTASEYGIICKVADVTGYVSFQLQQGSGDWTVHNFFIQANKNICDNKWHEIMFSWNGTTTANAVKLYVDGDLITSGTAKNTETTLPTSYLTIGNLPTGGTGLIGDIDEILITDNTMGTGSVYAYFRCDDGSSTSFISTNTISATYTPTITGTTVISNDSMPIVKSDGSGGYCRYFNGRSDRITFTNQVIPLGTKSIRFKFRKGNSPSVTQYILSNLDNIATQNGFGIYIKTTGDINFSSYQASATARFSINAPSVCDGLWHDILFTWDGTTNTNAVKIYVDDMVNPKSQTTALNTETTSAYSSLVMGALTSLSSFGEFEIKEFQINVGTGTERTSIKDLKVGDFIACNYVATSGAVGTFSNLGVTPTSYIPPTSSATPNGSFYFIHAGYDYKGRMKLIADRNIQHSISWDTLNSGGIIYGNQLLDANAIPNMSSNTTPSGIASASTISSTTYDAYKAFDKTLGSQIWSAVSGTTTGWIAYQFTSPKVIKKYTITDAGAIDRCPKNWTFEGSNDGGTWVVLDTIVNASWVLGVKNQYTIENNNAYISYRLNISANNGNATFLQIAEIEMFEKTFEGTLVRSLSGGTSSTDTDNEWDKIIVNSTLNGTITAGDNNIWNWSLMLSWTSSTTTSSNTFRMMRGNGSVSGYTYNTSSSATNTQYGFRPMLLVESLTRYYHFIKDTNGIYSINDGFYNLGSTITEEQILSYSANNYTSLITPITQNKIPVVSKGVLGTGTLYESMKLDFTDVGSSITFVDGATPYIQYSVVKAYKPIEKLNNTFDLLLYLR